MNYRITHRTTYAYTQPALNCRNHVHLTPRELPRQRCGRRAITIKPSPPRLTYFTDYYGNAATAFHIDEPHDRLVITATSWVEVDAAPEIDLAASMPWERAVEHVRTDRSPASIDAYQYVFCSPYVRRKGALAEYARPSFTPGRPLLEAALDLTRRVHDEFEYKPKVTTLSTSIDEVLDMRRGVCQDFAHLQIGCLRSLGVPARYVSGYLRTDPPPGKPRLVGADASHAWLEAYCPTLGWVALDPTNACLASDRHIVLALGRDYGDVSPIKGVVLGGGDHELTVTVDAEPA